MRGLIQLDDGKTIRMDSRLPGGQVRMSFVPAALQHLRRRICQCDGTALRDGPCHCTVSDSVYLDTAPESDNGDPTGGRRWRGCAARYGDC